MAEKKIEIPSSLFDALRPAMAELGMPPVEGDRIVPKINIDESIRTLAMKLGGLLKNCGLYRFGDERKLIAMQAGKWPSMNANRFTGWVEEFVEVVKSYRGKGGMAIDVETSMGKELAQKIMEQDVFLDQIPMIEQFAPVRVPVVRENGGYELLQVGYDAEAKVYCHDDIAYDLEMKVPQAMEVIEDFHLEFPFADMKFKDGKPLLWGNRSFLVHLSAMLGVYCRLLLPPGTIRPIIGYYANEQGSGKSLLVSMALAPVFGLVKATDMPLNGKNQVDAPKFTVLLETVAQTWQPYLFLDDVPGSVFSNALNRFVTSPKHAGRKFGKNDEMFEVPNVTQVFLTGNNVHTAKDVMQRALICELFSTVDSESRTPTKEITSIWLSKPAQRTRLLAALHCFFREWVKSGANASTFAKRRTKEWSDPVGGMLECIGVVDNPFAAPELPMSGDTESIEFRQLLTILADDAYNAWIGAQEENKPWNGHPVTTQDIVTTARTNALLVGLVGLPDDKNLNKGELIKLGRRLEQYRGKEDMVTSGGKKFRFGHRRQRVGTVYPIEWLD